MLTIPRVIYFIKSFEALILFNITFKYLITYLLHKEIKSQKSDYSQISIKVLTDAIALRRDSNFSSFPAKVLF
jgi:hypothetical protein